MANTSSRALRLLRCCKATGDQDTIAESTARALAKITQVMPSRLRRQAGAVAAMTESATTERPLRAT